jgi:outer membrane protein OmpA-like peptidoglycan-associated protein
MLTRVFWLSFILSFIFWDQVLGQIPANGLLVHYSFNSNLKKSGSPAQSATLYGAVLAPDRFDRPNSALIFNGEKQYVSLGGDQSLKPTKGLTVALWAYRADWRKANSGHLISNFEFAGYSIALRDGKTLSATLQTVDGSLNISYSISMISNGWHHLALSFDGQKLILYFDSQPVAMSLTAAPTQILQHSNNHTFLGVSASRDDKPWYYEENYFEGMLDDLYVYDRALSEQEVIYLFEDSPPVPLKGFVYNRKTGKKIAAEIDIDGKKYSCSAEKGYSAQLKPKADKKTVHITSKGFFGKVEYIPQGVYPFEQNFELEPISINESVVLNNISFAQNSALLLESSFQYLDSIVVMMKENTGVRIEISGHTEIAGNPKANQILSEARAKAVADYLIKNGIETHRIVSLGFGGSRPLSSEDDEESRKKNRRVEFKILSF